MSQGWNQKRYLEELERRAQKKRLIRQSVIAGVVITTCLIMVFTNGKAPKVTRSQGLIPTTTESVDTTVEMPPDCSRHTWTNDLDPRCHPTTTEVVVRHKTTTTVRYGTTTTLRYRNTTTTLWPGTTTTTIRRVTTTTVKVAARGVVPDIRGLRETDASKILSDAGFNSYTALSWHGPHVDDCIYSPFRGSHYEVFDQDPPPSSSELLGTWIYIYICPG